MSNYNLPTFVDFLSMGFHQVCYSRPYMYILLPLISLLNLKNFPLFLICQGIFWIILYLPTRFAVNKYFTVDRNNDDMSVAYQPQLILIITLILFSSVYLGITKTFLYFSPCDVSRDTASFVDSSIPNTETLQPVTHFPSMIDGTEIDSTWAA